MIHDIKETKELLAAGATVYREIAKLGTGSMLRLGLAIADDVPTIVSGLHGAHQVPAELADLTPEEAAQLQDELRSHFIDATDARVLEAIEASAAATLAGVVAVRKWRDALAAPQPTEEVPA